MSTTPPAGWHTDPSDPAQLRWWDGKGWTEHTRAALEGERAAVSPQPPWPASSPPPQLPFGSSEPASWQTPYQYQSSPGYSGPGQRPRLGLRRTMWANQYRNAMSVRAMSMAAIYLLIGLVTHFLFLGIFPILLSVGALRRREPLAPVALVVSVLPLVLLLVLHRY